MLGFGHTAAAAYICDIQQRRTATPQGLKPFDLGGVSVVYGALDLKFRAYAGIRKTRELFLLQPLVTGLP